MYISISIEKRTQKVNTDFIAMLSEEDHTVCMAWGEYFALSDKDYNEIEKALFPTRKKVATVNVEQAEYLNQLHKLTGGKIDAVLTPERKRKLDKLLQTFSKEQLIIAATNIGNDKWLQGDNDAKKRYGDIDYLLRPDKAAKWAEFKAEDKRKPLF